MKVYIAGPMSGLPDFNRPAFHDAERFLAALGNTCINPAHHDIEDGTWEQYLALALHVVHNEQPDAIVLLPGWAESRGARLELEAFRLMRRPVFLLHRLSMPGQYYITVMEGSV